MNDTKIVAICLIRNEEVYIKQVLLNILDFCDKIIVADNISEDETYKIVRDLARQHSKINCLHLKNRSESQGLIQEYAGTHTWILGVDGDEIYDPKGLQILRKKLLAGDYDSYTNIYGNVLNCSEIDMKTMTAKGYMAPPCRSMTKLYNYYAVTDCSSPSAERLHVEKMSYRDCYDEKSNFNLYEQFSWDESHFRCLHVCFLPRSSKDKATMDRSMARPSGLDLDIGGPRTIIKRWIFRLLGRTVQSNWKLEKYMRGDLVAKNVSPFFNKYKGKDDGCNEQRKFKVSYEEEYIY